MKTKVISFLLVVVLGCLLTACNTDEKQYEEANSLMNEGKYAEAAEIFEDLGDYEDAANQASEAWKEDSYQRAIRLMDQGNYQKALSRFENLKDFRDSEAKVQELKEFIIPYADAEQLMTEEKYEDAIEAFNKLGDYGDSMARINEAQIKIRDKKVETSFKTAMEDGTIKALNDFLYRWGEAGYDELVNKANEQIALLKSNSSLSAHILNHPDKATEEEINAFLKDFPGHQDYQKVQNLCTGDILTLLEKGSITVEITGRQNRYMAWVDVTITNKTSLALTVTIPNGVYFETSSLNVPNMAVYGEQTISIPANGSNTKDIRALSMTITPELPGTSVQYTAKHISNAKLEQVIQLLDEADENEHVGLAALWLVTGNYDDYMIRYSWVYKDGTAMISEEELARAKEIVKKVE